MIHRAFIPPLALLALSMAGCDNSVETNTDSAGAPVETEIIAEPDAALPEPLASDTIDPAGPHRFASWAGRWTGPEGLFVQIAPAGPGRYRLEMQSDLDTRGTYEGRDDEHGIRFDRGGQPFQLRRASGEETGLRYLAGKQDCIMVREGEGYCRD